MAGWTPTPQPVMSPPGWTENPQPEQKDVEGWYATRSYPSEVPAAVATAVALAPSHTLDVITVIPPAAAQATPLAPVGRSGATGAVPAAQAAASALPPIARVDVTPGVPAAQGTAQGLAPVPTVDVKVDTPPATAGGNAQPPQIIISHIADVDAAAAAAMGLEPAVRVDVVVAVPPATAAAVPLDPGGGWSQPPTVTQYTTAGTFTFNIPVWCNFIDAGLWGGGRGGRGGGPALSGGGGAAGALVSGTLQRGVHFPAEATQLKIYIAPQSIGSAGAYLVADPNPNGGPTRLFQADGVTLIGEAAGATTESGSQNGQSCGAIVLNGVSYPGGNGGTGNGGNATGNGAGAAGGNLDFGFAGGSRGGNGSVGKAVLVARSN